MICTNCLEADYQTSKTELTVTINGQSHVLHDLDCETCPSCGEVTFTQGQSIDIDTKRIALEFSTKPTLTPVELKTLRSFLRLNLNETCDLLHIGRNSYGRWERGEVAITPSMNLLVHNLIARIPDAPVNIFARERFFAIEKANAFLVNGDLSFGGYLRQVISLTRLMPDIVSASVGIASGQLASIENDEFPPEKIPPQVTAKIAHFFNLPFEILVRQLNELLKIIAMRNSATAVHDWTSCYEGKGMSKESDVAKLQKAARVKGAPFSSPQVSAEYLAKVKVALQGIECMQSEAGGLPMPV